MPHALLRLIPRRWLLRQHGSRLMAEYVRAVQAITEGDRFDTEYAESVCPKLKRYRRRAKACIRLINRKPKPITP